MLNSEKNENLDICLKCGGKCCLKCGCDYSVSDFESLTYKSLLESLSAHDKSIVAMFNFKNDKNGRVVAEPFFYIRARNNNRDIIDLLSMKTRCAELTENGCMYDYEHRPFGGKNLIPSRPSDGPCIPKESPLEYIKKWTPYQNVLRRIIKEYTGMSVDKVIRLNVEDLFYDVLMKNFKDVSPLEILDLKSFVPLLALAYPLEYKNAKEKADKNTNKLVISRNINDKV